ncbi:MAG TPA: MFS transporter [Herpetosiphonaceae bacterium]
MNLLLRHRNFRLLWTGALISMIGDWMLMTALPIYVYQLTGSALATSITFAASTLPGLALSSIAGVFVDRWDRRQVMVVCNVLFALALLPLLAVRSPGQVWIAYAVAFAQSCIARFFRPAENALLPLLVGEDDLVGANALNALNDNLARLAGPPLGGLIAGAASLGGVVAADALSFAVAALLIALVRPPAASNAAEAAAPAETQPPSVGRELRAGLALAWRRPMVRLVCAIGAICSIGEGMMSVMFILWVSKVLGGGAREVGWFMGAQAIGGIIGGLIIGRVAKALGTIRLLWVSGVLFGAIDLLLFNYPRVAGGLWPGLALIALVGVPAVGFFTAQTSLLQQHVPDAYRGRVFGAIGMLSAGCYLASTLLAGLIGGGLEPMAVLTVQGAAYMAAGLLVLVSASEPRPGGLEPAPEA